MQSTQRIHCTETVNTNNSELSPRINCPANTYDILVLLPAIITALTPLLLAILNKKK